MSVSARLPCRLWRGHLKREFLEIFLSKSFRVGNVGNTEAMTVIVFWKCSKFNAALKNAEKKREKIFCFWDKCIWIVCIELSLLRKGYLSSAVNVLTKRLSMSLRVTLSHSITFRVIIESGKRGGIETESAIRDVYHVVCWGVVSKGTF